MAQYIALLRAVNVGGTGKLPMADLRAMATKLGFTDVQTYIQSGNLVFSSPKTAHVVKSELESALGKKLGKACAVLLRSADELKKVEAKNPFRDAEPARVLVVFLDGAPDKKVVASVKPPGREEIVAGAREIYIHFPDGMGKSKLKIPFTDIGTGRNLNTLRALLKITFPA